MRGLCCLDCTNIEQVSKAIFTLLTVGESTIGLIYVTDSGPRGEIERKREGLLRPRTPSGPLGGRMRQAEVAAAQDILQEGQRYLPDTEALHREGKPEREIVQCAAEWHADLIIISPRPPLYAGLASGPRSVGHVARFVLDHAPCPVLLLRSATNTSA